ncbi:hypothetical protein NE235_03120 [Actinoallomurus spadix]|uniref:Uncharacterized protein n=1 Tax=Actinoallomurus spadix TaxID=79912 RepID=A0ABP3HDP4_9ACTN|nr:hypothetical protein [Actinoallomurus spadix]MCO5985096.1 hypothetical protein [Actinoallomurus spadix]
MGDDKQITQFGGKALPTYDYKGRKLIWYQDDNQTTRAPVPDPTHDPSKPGTSAGSSTSNDEHAYLYYVYADPKTDDERKYNATQWKSFQEEDAADHSDATAADDKSIKNAYYPTPPPIDKNWPGIGRKKGIKHDSHAIQSIQDTLGKDFKTYEADWKQGDGSIDDIEYGAALQHKEIGDWDVAKQFHTTIEQLRGTIKNFYGGFLSQQGAAIAALGTTRANVAGANAKAAAATPKITQQQPTQQNTGEY